MKVTISVSESAAANPSWWKQMTLTEKKQYIKDHPRSRFAKQKKAIKKVAKVTASKSVDAVRKGVSNVRDHISGLGNVLNPGVEASDADKRKAKKILGIVAKTVLVGVLAVGMGTALGGVARSSASHFQDYLKGNQSFAQAIMGDSFGGSRENRERARDRARDRERVKAQEDAGSYGDEDDTASESATTASYSATGKQEDAVIGRIHDAFGTWLKGLSKEQQREIMKEAKEST